jgi:hypothetical protein
MLSLKINDKISPIKIKLFQNWIFLYESELSKYELAKVNINSNNKIQIIENDKIIQEYTLNPIIENYYELLLNMKNNDIHCNVDIYEELIPFKYIIKKINNNLYYDSLYLLLSNNIEK